MAEKDLRINEQIRVREVRLIRDDGDQEIMPTSEAFELAREAGLDLVEVAPQANPPRKRIVTFTLFPSAKKSLTCLALKFKS